MTEQEWLACTDPVPMLAWLVEQRQRPYDQLFHRKLYAFGAACLAGKYDSAHVPGFERAGHEAEGRIWMLVFHPEDSDHFWYEYADAGDALAYVRDIFGNPFRPAVIPPAVLTPTVVSLAQAVYDERILPGGELDKARLAVLADALEEAGCTDADVLGHLRGAGPHVRGCWAADLLLSQEPAG